MHRVKKIAKGNVALLIGSIANKLALLVFFSFLARHFGAEKLGDFYFLITLSSLFTIFANFGLDVLTMREIGKDHNSLQWFYPNVALIKLCLSLVSICLTYIYLVLGRYSPNLISIGLVSSLITVGMTNMNHTDSIFRGMEKFNISAIMQILNALLILGGGYALLYGGAGLKQIMLVMVVSYFLTAIASNIQIIIEHKVSPFAVNFSRWKAVLKDAYPFMITSALSVIYYRLDVLLLSQFSGNAAVGSYGAAAKIIENYGLIPTIFVTSIFPMMSRQYANSPKSLQKTANLALKYLLVISLPLTALSIVDAPKIIRLFYGEQFSNSTLVFQILCIRAFSSFVTTLLGYLLFSANRQKLYMQFSMVAIAVNVILNILLIPKYSFLGPPLAIVGSTIVSLSFHLYFAKKYVCQIHLVRHTIKPLVASVAAGIVIVFSPYNVFIDFAIAASVYGAVAFGLAIFDKYDLQLLKSVFQFQAAEV
jgi:O-antigen/teichoic acid export membrane protein